MAKKIVIGTLDLQGAVEEHLPHLRALGVEVIRVRSQADLTQCDGLIIPGGESTSFLKLISYFNLKEALIQKAKDIPYWGICAGAILMANKVTNPEQDSLKLIDCEIERNSYGRQLQSFVTQVDGETVAFIRAPKIKHFNQSVMNDSRFSQLRYIDETVHLKDETTGHQVSSFHPELSPNVPSDFHRNFLKTVEQIKAIRRPAPSLEN